jgi:hypothetical protein
MRCDRLERTRVLVVQQVEPHRHRQLILTAASKMLQREQPVRQRIRQCTQEHGIHEREHRCRRADTQCECNHCDSGEAGAARKAPQREADLVETACHRSLLLRNVSGHVDETLLHSKRLPRRYVPRGPGANDERAGDKTAGKQRTVGVRVRPSAVNAIAHNPVRGASYQWP